ncbi:MAG TPA: M20/M25/M40 family metallo-hydrolase, partial [Thermodesulfobacteriota bacterium]|nr:M20/M25/M40 family metallo-hydrolase [Thermodesulfobacteriota bacterium]
MTVKSNTILTSCAFFALTVLWPPAFLLANPPLLDRANQARSDFLKDLEIFVNIDSPSDYAPGMEKVRDFLSAKLNGLGGSVETQSPARAGHNIVSTWKGSGKGKILLLAHSDTVFKPGTAAQRPFRTSGGKAYGPGVFDEKGGVIAGLYALKLLKDSGFNDFARITYLINCDEEIGSVSSKDLIRQLAQEHDFALCLEGGREGDAVVSWRKGSARMVVEVKGRSSHAGAAPDRGANALVELAHQILQLRALENRERGTTITFTVFKAGDKSN